MKLAMRIIVGFLGLAFIAAAIRIQIAPDMIPSVVSTGIEGVASLRAHYIAFYLTAGIFSLLGAYYVDPSYLGVPMLLGAAAFFSRFVSLLSDGITHAGLPPMIAEAGIIVIFLLAAKNFEDEKLKASEHHH